MRSHFFSFFHNTPMYSGDFATFEPMPPSQTHHIIWNLLLADKQMELTPKSLEDNKICHIIAILPHERDYLEMNQSIPDFPYTILEYGDHHNTSIDKVLFDKCGSFIDSVAQNAIEGRRNILVFCNNGYQRSIPFLVYYLTHFHSNEVPSIEKALSIILSQVDKNNYDKMLKDMVVSVSKLLVE